MGSHLTDIVTDEGWVEVIRHSPTSHVASVRVHVYYECRRQGAGRRLLRTAIISAHFAGITRLEATPYCDNPESTAFFESLEGWEREGRRRAGGKRENGELVDTWLYAHVIP